MVRFIFVCMGVVALSLLSLAGQFMLDGIEGARNQIAARNDAALPQADVVAVDSSTPNPEQLNAIDTAAGDDAAQNAPGNQSFGATFSTDAPAGLQDVQAVPSAETTPIEDAGY